MFPGVARPFKKRLWHWRCGCVSWKCESATRAQNYRLTLASSKRAQSTPGNPTQCRQRVRMRWKRWAWGPVHGRWQRGAARDLQRRLCAVPWYTRRRQPCNCRCCYTRWAVESCVATPRSRVGSGKAADQTAETAVTTQVEQPSQCASTAAAASSPVSEDGLYMVEIVDDIIFSFRVDSIRSYDSKIAINSSAWSAKCIPCSKKSN